MEKQAPGRLTAVQAALNLETGQTQLLRDGAVVAMS
jgi:hypothetical protein